MNERLEEIIRYKTGGKKIPFAELMGWSPQYLSKMLRGENFGVQPILTVLEKLPEINARWFLFGTGEMLEIGKLQRLFVLLLVFTGLFRNEVEAQILIRPFAVQINVKVERGQAVGRFPLPEPDWFF